MSAHDAVSETYAHGQDREITGGSEPKAVDAQRRVELVLEQAKSRNLVDYVPRASYVTTGLGQPQ